MITAEIQIHGYRKGHQLFASSINLSKDDQAVVDRLSDVAGPLRPKEFFTPYLSAYSLPSESYYVLARTWQDLGVSRAGCVRTKSVLIDAQSWASKQLLHSILRLLDSAAPPTELDAVSVELEEQSDFCFPPVPNFGASELLEALFLEEAKPVVVFDSPESELIAIRLLAALWPNLRRRFSLSTLALSPRKIGGRDFNLVFAPSNAKARFSDWGGRRVDGRSLLADRHRWTGAIVRRVFEEPVPRLLSDNEINLLGARDADNVVALRIALLWDELLGKLDRVPTAALGLLDIANSGTVNNAAAVKSLEPRFVEATRKAAGSLPLKDAWDFVGAIAQKMQGHDMPVGKQAIEELATNLAERSPDGAISLLQQPDLKGSIGSLIPSIAVGLGNGAKPNVEQMLLDTPADLFARLILHSSALTSRIAKDEGLIGRLGIILTEIDQELAGKAGRKLLPFLTEDRQLTAAMPIFNSLDSREIAAELRWLGDSNNFGAKQLAKALINRAREVQGFPAVREVLISSNPSAERDVLLEQTIEPVTSDVLWLLDEKRLPETTINAMLVNVLRRADDKQLSALLSKQEIVECLETRLPEDAIDVLARALMQKSFPINACIRTIQTVIPKFDNVRKQEIVRFVLERCLRSRFDSEEISVLHRLLGFLGAHLDGGWVAKTGLERSIDAEIASRNLIAFEKAPSAARKRIVETIDVIAWAIQDRRTIDLTEEASNACAKLMFDAEKVSRRSVINAAGILMSSLLRARRQPVSLMVAALFPVIYQELAKSDDVPTFLMFIPFFDWDRCKAARDELVNAFMLSSWKEGDLALTAYRCGDLSKILKRVIHSYGGKEYIKRIEKDLGRLDSESKRLIKRTIAEISSNSKS